MNPSEQTPQNAARLAQEWQPAGRPIEGVTLRREDAAGDVLPVSGNAEWALPASWWTQHGSEDRGWYRANQARRNEAR